MNAETRAVIREVGDGLLVELCEEITAGLEFADEYFDFDERLDTSRVARGQSVGELPDERLDRKSVV